MSSIPTFLWGEDQDPETGAGFLKVTQQANRRDKVTTQGLWFAALFVFFSAHKHTNTIS